MLARKLFDDFLRARGLSRVQAAVALGVQPSTLHYWMHASRPREAMRAKIAAWTTGAVPAASWLSDEESADIAATQPAPEPAEASGPALHTADPDASSDSLSPASPDASSAA